MVPKAGAVVIARTAETTASVEVFMITLDISSTGALSSEVQ
jgi:hypothetical protein